MEDSGEVLGVVLPCWGGGGDIKVGSCLAGNDFLDGRAILYIIVT